MKHKSIQIAFFDVDGTLHRGKTIWEIMHRKTNTWHSHGLGYLQDFLTGKLCYESFARADVKAWKGVSEKVLYEAIQAIQIYPEVEYIFKELRAQHCKIYLISSGISQLAEALVQRYELTGYYANPILLESGYLTGEISIVVPYESKGEIVRSLMARYGIAKKNALAIGDGVADILMMKEVGCPIFLVQKNTKTILGFNGFAANSWHEIINHLDFVVSDSIYGYPTTKP